ncbi:MAG: hypothetical protein LBP53_01785 [Candidatus Peribacteria bacterium]|jgi:hypothetical protein|nr:hypothetical protein [Candidatus Peribacteria bacterium]
MKDSYMNFNSDEGKEVFYSYVSEFCTNVIDCSYIYHSEHCFNCCDIKNGFNCFFSHDLENCSDCYFCSDLVSCKFCYGSHGLRNANYVRFGEHKTKEEWLALFAQYHKVQNFNEASQHSSELALPIPKKHLTLTNTENCAGDYLTNSKNLTSCFDMVESEDCKYVTYSAF